MRRSALVGALGLVAVAAHAGDGGAPRARVAHDDPDAPRVGASLDRTQAHVGDRLTLTVSAVAHGALAATVRLPSHLDLGKFEVLDSSTSDRDLGDGNRSRRFVLQIAAYDTGELELPPIVLEYADAKGERRTVETTTIPVLVKSLIKDDPKAEVQALKATREVMIEDRRLIVALWWSAIGATGLVALWLAVLLYRRRQRRPVVVKVVPLRPPDEVALERLAELRRRGGFDSDGYRPFYFAVAEIVRGYLGARFHFAQAATGLELTTTDLCLVLEGILDDALVGQRAAIRAFLDQSDLVKFAKAGSDDRQARAALDAAEAIITATRPVAATAITEKIAGSGEAAHG